MKASQSISSNLIERYKAIFFLLMFPILSIFHSCSSTKIPYEQVKKVKQVYLTNHVVLKNGNYIKYNGSAFLIKYKGELFACTAKHVVEKAKYFKKKVKAKNLNEQLDYWNLFPRKTEKPIIKVDSLFNNSKSKSEWWLLALEETNTKTQKKIQSFEPRFDLVKKDERVFFLGCSYQEENCKQNVYLGKVNSVNGKKISISYDPLVNVAGFSGGPLLDAKGKLIGLLTQASYDQKLKVHKTIFAETTVELKKILQKVDELKEH